MIKRAALYARVASVRQTDADSSIPEQRRAIHAFCQLRGLSIVAEYIDAGASGTDENHPEFQRMVDDAIRGVPGFDLIVVHSLSRFFRNAFLAEMYRRRLRKAGVEVVSISEASGDGPNTDLMRQFISLMDVYQSKENAKRTLRGMEENARQGFVNGRPPFGYRAVVAETRGAKLKKRLEIDPSEAEIVRLIFRLSKAGPIGSGPPGAKAIAKELNRQNLRTRSGQLFSSPAHDVLHRTTHIGRDVFNATDRRTKEKKPADKHIVVPVPAIIDEATFEAVQAALRKRDPMRVERRFQAGRRK